MENKLSPLQQALLDSVLAEYAHIPQEKEIHYTFSERFETWAKKLIAETDKAAPKRRLSKTVKILIIVAAILALLAACAVAIPALREGLVDFFLTEKVDHYGITFDPEKAAYAPDSVEEYRVPQWMAEGFTLEIEDKSPAMVFMVWENKAGEIITYNQVAFRQDVTKDDWIGFSSEGVERSSAIICGYKVEILQDVDMYTVIWTDNQYLYYMEITNSVDLTVFEKILGSMMIVGKGAYGITFDPEQAANAPDCVEEYHVPQYAPDGFELVVEDKSIAAVVVVWTNDKDDIIAYNQVAFRQDVTKDDWIGFSSEGVERSSVIICGYKVEILQDVDMYTAIWTDNEYFYYMEISNSVDLTEFEKILCSMAVVGRAYGITFDPEQAANAPDSVEEYRIPQYVPEGYTNIIDDKSAAMVTIAWMNDQYELICYNQIFIPEDVTNDDWVGISSENVTRTTIIVSGYKVEIIQDETVYTAVWTDNEYIYFLELPNSLGLTVFAQILNSITAVS